MSVCWHKRRQGNGANSPIATRGVEDEVVAFDLPCESSRLTSVKPSRSNSIIAGVHPSLETKMRPSSLISSDNPDYPSHQHFEFLSPHYPSASFDNMSSGVSKNQAPLKPLRDLETSHIVVPRLIQELSGIYAGLVMVEKKCINLSDQQSESSTIWSAEQWQALIVLHRTLLHEHHDFFSDSRHPICHGDELRELTIQYAMPARMWRHVIHTFLELSRHDLPNSIEHMVSFLYLSHSMAALLKKVGPDFTEIWRGRLGDLARYRMAIENANLGGRDIRSITARTWNDEVCGKQKDGVGLQTFVRLLDTRDGKEAVVPRSDRFTAHASLKVNANAGNDLDTPRASLPLRRYLNDVISHMSTKITRCVGLIFLAQHPLYWIPAASAAPFSPEGSDPPPKNPQDGNPSVLLNWIIPLLTLTLITGGDMLIDRTRHHKSSIFHAMNCKAATFWATFNPPAAAAMLCLSGVENEADPAVFMLLLACQFNQFRRCIHEVMSAPEAIILIATLWAVSQHILLQLTAHDPATQRVARWMMVSFAITIVTKLGAFWKRLWGVDSPRSYDNTHISGGFAILGDYHHHEQGS